MKGYALSVLTVLLFVTPAWANPEEPQTSRDGAFWDPEIAIEALSNFFHQGRAFIRDHIEWRGHYEPNSHDGTTRGDVTLRLYPKGKRQSDQHLTAEAWFQFKNNPGERGLQFDLRIQENRDTTTHVLPENSL